MIGSRLLADSGLYRTVIQFSDTARHLVHILVYLEVIERRKVGRGGGNPDLQHSTLLIVLPHRLLLLQVHPSIYTEVKVHVIGNVLYSRGWGPFTQQGVRAKEQVNLSTEVPLVPF